MGCGAVFSQHGPNAKNTLPKSVFSHVFILFAGMSFCCTRLQTIILGAENSMLAIFQTNHPSKAVFLMFFRVRFGFGWDSVRLRSGSVRFCSVRVRFASGWVRNGLDSVRLGPGSGSIRVRFASGSVLFGSGSVRVRFGSVLFVSGSARIRSGSVLFGSGSVRARFGFGPRQVRVCSV